MSSSSSSTQPVVDRAAIYHAQTFIKAMVRAFYDDTAIIIMDTLLRERYITLEEIGPRLKIANKIVNSTVTQLQGDHLVEQEEVKDTASKSVFHCIYVDYQRAMDTLLFRLYQMEELIREEERKYQNEEYFECPSCHHHYTSLEAMKYMTPRYKYLCFRCCPHGDINQILEPEAYYTLKLVNNQEEMRIVRELKTKMHAQFKEEEHCRIGIYDFKRVCKDLQVIQNLPSVNISRGIKTSSVVDYETKEKIAHNLQLSASAKNSSANTSKVNARQMKKILNSMALDDDLPMDHMQIEIIDADGNVQGGDGNAKEGVVDQKTRPAGGVAPLGTTVNAPNTIANVMEQSKPMFLKGSGVLGADTVLQSVDNIQAERVQGLGKRDLEGSDDERDAKRKNTEDNSIFVPTIDIDIEEFVHEPENIVWEEEDAQQQQPAGIAVEEEEEEENIEWDE